MLHRFKCPYITVTVEYNLQEVNDKIDFDNKLTKLAEKYCGVEGGGAGYHFVSGMRDIDYDFVNLKKAKQFFHHVKKFKCVGQVSSRVCFSDR